MEANTLSGKRKATPATYTIDEKAKSATLTEEGVLKVEKLLKVDNLYDPRNIEILHHVKQALRAHAMYKRDVDYVVKDGEVMIVDEFTGRLMPGRRWSDGLHQAIEAKEGVKIENENQTLATITFQNYFRMYEKLSGMTGTADTEAEEFHKIYKLDVMVIPTNRPLLRPDFPDVVYKTEKGEVQRSHRGDQGTSRQRAAGVWSAPSPSRNPKCFRNCSKSQGIPHNVLNAKQHEKEAEIVCPGRPQGRPSPSPPTWPAAVPTSCWAAIREAMAKQWRRANPEATDEEYAGDSGEIQGRMRRGA